MRAGTTAMQASDCSQTQRLSAEPCVTARPFSLALPFLEHSYCPHTPSVLWQSLSDAFLPNLYYFDEISKEMKVTPYLEEATVTSRGVDPHSVTGSTSQRLWLLIHSQGFSLDSSVSSTSGMWKEIKAIVLARQH